MDCIFLQIKTAPYTISCSQHTNPWSKTSIKTSVTKKNHSFNLSLYWGSLLDSTS